MSERRLVLVIDSDDATCGACPHYVVFHAIAASHLFARCDLFRRQLSDSLPHQRLAQCLEAESAARPWEGDPDDDDGTPHHLREKA
jgi:hypothetical protein